MNSISGKVVQITELTSGTSASGYAYAKQFVVVEFGEEYPRTAAFEFDPDKKPECASLQAGDEIKMYFLVSSSPSKDKKSYFSNLKVRSFEMIRQATPAAGRRAVNQEAPPTPPTTTVPPTSAQAFTPPTDESDELPF